MPGILFTSGLGVAAVGLVACADFLERGEAHGLLATAAIAVLGAGTALALVGGQLVIKTRPAPVSAAQLLLGSVVRSILVVALISGGIAWHYGPSFALDMVRVVGRALPVVVAIDLIAFLSVSRAGVPAARP